VGKGKFRGRVEHIVSMRARNFHSLKELAAFIEQAIATLPQEDESET
jgi:hypothetical protein